MRFVLLLCFCLNILLPAASFCEESIEKRLSEAIHFDPSGPNPIGYLRLEKNKPINESTYLYVKFALDKFKAQKVPFVVLDLDTPGGEVFAAVKISELLKRLDREDRIPVIAYINNWALSAGALLAYSCRFIAIQDASSMGAAEPVIAGEGGKMESASEKITSALRAEFANAAAFFGRDPLIAEAMVDKDILLVQRGSKIVQLESEQDLSSRDTLISRKGKLLTLNASELLALKVADFKVPYKSFSMTSAEESTGLIPAGGYPLFQEPFLASIPGALLMEYRDWRIDFFAFLSHPLVSSMLMMGLLIGIYGEMSQPGFGFFGGLALICLTMILLSSFAVEAAGVLDLILLFSGLVLLGVEVFVLPSFGFVGLLGIVLTLIGLFAVMMPRLSGVKFSFDVSEWSLPAIELSVRLAWLLSAFVLSIIAIALMARFVVRGSTRWSRLVLKGEQNKEEGFHAIFDQAELPPVGAVGTAFTPLRPSGKVLLHGKLYEAQSESGFIEKDEEVSLLRFEAGKLIVTPSQRPL